MKKILLPLAVLTLLFASLLFAGNTGKIAGTIIDDKTGEPLIGVNVIVVGTSFGAATDFEGNYSIINIPPGTYSIRASALGYGSQTMQNLQVNIDLTTHADFKLAEEAVQLGKEVIITAERPLVQKDLTATTAVVGGDDIKQLPVTEISQVIGLQAGSVEGRIRGGRAGEVAYWIDGVPVTDAFNGGTVVDVNPNMVQELQVLSGAFNAEYGQAMSGIVNISTREGTDKFSGSVTAYGGDYLSGRNDVFKGIQYFNPLNIRNIEGSLSGPIIPGDVSFFLNARSIYFGGYLDAIQKFHPWTQGASVDNRFFIFGESPSSDSAYLMTQIPDSLKPNFASIYNNFRAANKNNVGDGKDVSMNWNKKLYLQGKITTKITPLLKLNITGIYDGVESQPYDRYYQYNPEGKGKDYNLGYTGIMQLSHTLNNSTFYTLGLSFFQKSYKHYLYENPYDTRYVNPDYITQITPYSFAYNGNENNRFYRLTRTILGKLDVSSQINNEHFVKFGVEARKHRIFYEDITLIENPLKKGTVPYPYMVPFIDRDTTNTHDRYVHTPTEFSAYVQDKMEFKDLIINIGVRFDYFEPDGQLPVDPQDPNIYSPYKPKNQFFDANNNGIQDPGEATKTYADRAKYWYKKASAKYQFSPRFGASFPITDRGVIHFSYGHFLQIPNFERLYQNPLYKYGKGTDNQDYKGAPTGNPDLKPEQTINGEIGLQQQLTDDISLDVTAYIRDIRNLAGTRSDPVFIGGQDASYYTQYVNSDFGYVKGFIVSLDKRFGKGLTLSVDYTFQIANGSASDPNETRNSISAGGTLPEVQLRPLDWDQRHTLNSVLSYSEDNYGASLIGQYGSGSPYTPSIGKTSTSSIQTLLRNSSVKPYYLNFDTRLYYTFPLDPIKLMVFLRVNNLFDIANEVGVYTDTGRANKTYDEDNARQSGVKEPINTISDFYVNPQMYSEPRRIEFGVTIDF